MSIRSTFSMTCNGPGRYGCHNELAGYATVGRLLDEARESGWVSGSAPNKHLCPYCAKRKQ